MPYFCRRLILTDGESGATICSDKCVSWVGNILLNARPMPHQGISESDFLTDWKDRLPEGWTKHVKLGALKVSYSLLLYSDQAVLITFAFSASILSHRKGELPAVSL